MTQEELDALMNEGDSGLQGIDGVESTQEQATSEDVVANEGFDPNNFRVHASKHWPPPPPDKDHKVVHQLDDVTRDTEVKAGEVFDQLDIISSNAEEIIEIL